jgi:amino acid adenylation domain-containing protein
MTASLREKRERLRSLLAARSEAGGPPPVEHRPGEDDGALSFAQQGLFFVSRIEGPNPAYNIPIVLRLAGELDVAALERALGDLVARHEPLRTRIIETGGVPRRVIGEPRPVRLAPRRPDPEAVEETYRRAANRPFEITADSLYRAELFAEADDRHVLVVSMHHVISDAWSVGVLLRELVALYEARAAGREPALDPLPVSYGDYVRWETDWLGSGVLERQLDHWEERLEGFRPAPSLLPDQPASETEGREGDTVDLTFPPGLLDAAKELSTREGCSLFVTATAALAVLLHRYSGRRDLAIGTGVARRRRPELEGLVGYFVDTLALRVGVTPEDSFRHVLQAARRVVVDALANLDAPYHRVVERLRLDRAAGQAALFQVMLTLQNVPYSRRIELPSLSLRAETPASGGAKFDLSIALQEEPDGLHGQIEYRSRRFDRATIERFGEHYVRLLGRLVADPAAAVRRHDFLGEAERRTLLEEWSGRAGAEAPEGTAWSHFEARAREAPEAVALVDGGRHLSYEGLRERAEGLAGRLAGAGVRPDSLVGVAAERRAETIVAILALLRSGAGYLPIDPDDPAERVRGLAEDAGVDRVLATSAVAERSSLAGLRRIVLDAPDPAGGAPEPPISGPDSGSLAYVMYTSGSTGRPKGVAVEHRSIVRLARGATWIDLDPATTTLQHSVLSFDASTFEIWAPLLNGGRLVLFDGEAADVDRLVAAVERQRVDTLWLTAGLLPLWVSRHAAGGPALRYLLAGGDVVPEKAVAEIHRRDPEVVVINGYGPTENTTFSCCHPIPRDRPAGGGLPIGGPIDGSSAYVLDDYLGVQPIGAVGELHVGGAGLARGYLGRPGATAERFGAGVSGGRPGERLYRTGDQVRWNGRGEIEFLGRVDNQVKLRGFRIELEEVELHLAALPEVAACAVVPRDDPVLGKRLVAYVVLGPDRADDGEEPVDGLRRALRSALPDYMVPSVFVVRDDLPLTPQGKIDRRALPAPTAEDVQRAVYRPPRTEVERAVCEVWQEVLQVDRVGLDDDFFELGGHSLLATRLTAGIRDRLGAALPLDQLFRGPTVAATVRYLGESETGPAAEEMPALVPDPERRYEPFPMTGVQQAYGFGRHGAFELGNVSTHAYVEMDLVDFDVARLERAWNALLRRHEMLRALFGKDGTQRIQAEVPEYRIPCDDLRVLPAAERERRLADTRERMSHQMFDLGTWPMFELRATRLSDERSRLHISMDALPSDAASSMIVVHELDLLYQDPGVDLPALDISFRDYVLALDEIRASPLWQRAWDYWERRAPELPPAPELPLAKNPSAVAHPRFERRYCVIEPERWRRLQELAQGGGITPSALLVAVFARVLARWSKGDRFTLNLTLFNRLPLHEQVDSLVGDFTSLVLLETDAGAPGSLLDLGRAVQARLWQDMEHRHFDGVDVLRLLRKESRGERRVTMPVVFTSALGLSRGEDHEAGPLARALADPWAAESFGITQTSQVWLDNVVSEAQGALTVTWDALGELFPPGLLDDMFAAYRGLLDALGAGEASPLDPCRPPIPEHQAAVRRAVNDTAVPRSEALLHDAFRERAAEHPERPAVVCGDTTLDYGTLDRHAGAIARRLAERGARSDELVAVVMHKGWEQVAAVLGVLYAGAAYLPIDAGLPEERIALLLDRGGSRLALAQPEVAAAIDWPAGVEVSTVEGPEPPAGPPPPRRALPSDVAYVIFTSGSTGTPKGVTIDHRGAVNTVLDVNRRFGVGPEDRVLGLSSMSFDLSVFDVFGVLGAGGALVLPEPGRERDAAHWVELVERHGVTLWNSVPTLVQLYAEELARSRPESPQESLRLVLMSGDWIPLDLPGKLAERCPRARRVSLGGATEASIWSIYHDIGEIDPEWPSVPYGRPLGNQTFHVLDAGLAPCPDWVPGELYIGGDGVALGYWGGPERTRESFVRLPATGERIYRTGDLGRYHPDGTLEFLGREDTQVKVFGHRIELGEIESTLAAHERVAAAVVVAVGTGTARRLAAYVVPAGQREEESAGDGAALVADAAQRAALRLGQRGLRRLPDDLPSVPLAGPDGSGWPDGPELRVALDEGLGALAERARSALGPGLVGAAAWSALTGVLAQVTVADHPIPKRAYPSAGSLYPLQVYCALRPGAVEGLPAGVHYYDPADHRMVRLAGEAPDELFAGAPADAGFVVVLVAAEEAPKALYGTLARRFCALEAGHVLALLAGVARARGVAFPLVTEGGGEGGAGPLRRALRLEEQHRVIGRWAGGAGARPAAECAVSPWAARQSYRRFLSRPAAPDDLLALFDGAPDDGVGVRVYLPSRAGGPAPGFYRLDRAECRLERLAEPDDDLVSRAHAPPNRSLDTSSSFTLFLTAESENAEALLAAGWLGQTLMHRAPGLGLGLCPVGRLDPEGIAGRLGVEAPARVVYCFVGGRIEPAQTRAWPVEEVSGEAEVDELRRYLRERLPPYMVPSVFVPLSALPLTANGKVDRKALPEIGEVSAAPERFEPPRDPLEETLARLWTEVLGVERIGVHDDFLSLGGHSLSATRLVSAIRKELDGDGEAVSLEVFFENPTVAGLAERISQHRDARRLTEVEARALEAGEGLEEGEI